MIEPVTKRGQAFCEKWTEGDDYAFGAEMYRDIAAIELEARAEGYKEGLKRGAELLRDVVVARISETEARGEIGVEAPSEGSG